VRARGAALALGVLLAAGAGSAVDRDADYERLQAAIAESRDRVARYEREERGLLDTLEAVERSAELLERDVVRARREARAARAELARAEALAGDLGERLARTERAMSLRSVALYKAGELGAVPLLFSADGLREFLSRVYTLRRLLVHDADLLARHRAEKAALDETRARAERAAAESSAAEKALAERSGQLSGERAQRRRLVSRLRQSRARERGALAELETASRALEETVAALPTPPPAALAERPRFESLRGRLEAPVEARIARGFGRVVDGDFLTATFRKGIEFDVPSGTPVHAVAAGQVRYAGRFRGYGNVVILDHGDRYFTVSAHLAAIQVAVGDAVRSREPIGLSGETGSLSGQKLYFEVRRGGEPLDPGEWLKPVGTAGRRR
jgi:septal ring factor EnvC (AmiA/AmiB activator)